MLIALLMASGAIGVLGAWWLVRAGVLSVWVAMGTASGLAGLAALATGRLHLSGRFHWTRAGVIGAGSGALLYAATVAFVLIVRRWHVFDRHVAEIYDQRKGLPLAAALVLAAGIISPGEELFWRGLFQGRLTEPIGSALATLATWAAYVSANAASGSLAIFAGAVVSGAVWGALAGWTRGVLASVLCHSVWTGFMVAWPPGGPSRRKRRRQERRA
jgi:membrane protease YdiL (CAAX protease family)